MTARLITLPYRPVINLRGGIEAGATLEVYNTGTLDAATIYADEALTTPLANPLTADAAGRFPPVYYDTTEPLIRVIIKTAAGETLTDVDPYTADTGSAEAAKDQAILSAAIAESLFGLPFASIAAGLAGTSDGDYFAVDNGDGTVTIYQNDGGSEVEVWSLLTTAAAASSDAGKGASLIGLEGGGSVQDITSTDEGSGADIIARSGPSVPTRTRLAALDTDIHPTAYLTEAGRVGAFRWDGSDLSAAVTADTAQGLYVPPTGGNGSTGAWVRVNDGVINVKWFGAKGDDSTNDTAAILAALTMAKRTGGEVVFPPGVYRHTGVSISDMRFVKIRGLAPASFATAGLFGVRLVCTSATANHFAFTNAHQVRVEDINFATLASVTPTAGTVISFVSTNGASASCGIRNVRIENNFNGILIDGCSNTVVENVQVRQSVGTYSVRLAAESKRLDKVFLVNVLTDSEVTDGSTTTDGFQILNDTHTTHIIDCAALKAKVGYNLTGSDEPPEFVYFIRSEAENCNSHGFLIDQARHPRFLQTYATDNEGSGMVFASTFDSTARLIDCDARANKGFGILLNGSGGVEIIGARIGGNSAGNPGNAHGIAVGAGVSNWAIIGGRIGGNVDLQGPSGAGQGFGILVNSGASDNYRIIGVDVRNNVTAGIDDNGTGENKQIDLNIGAPSDNPEVYGQATVTAGNTTGVFNHNIGSVPDTVIATPLGDVGANASGNSRRWWVTKNTTQAIVSLSSAPSTNVTFDIYVRA